jgi:hypothetical protein
MKPALAFPYYDPDRKLLPHLQAILPDLKAQFEHAYLSPPPSTLEWLDHDSSILTDDFFTVLPLNGEKLIGERFTHLYQQTGEAAHPDQPIHLCYLDRIAFALEGEYRDAFLTDVDSLSVDDLPLIFQRSPTAWATHPKSYKQIEGIVTTVGYHLFGRQLDYAWCHIVVRAGRLRQIMPLVKNPDLSMVAEMIFYMRDEIHTRDVDWLAWEDPFIFNRDPDELRHERENSLVETQKRLAYVLPMIETLTRLSRNGRNP